MKRRYKRFDANCDLFWVTLQRAIYAHGQDTQKMSRLMGLHKSTLRVKMFYGLPLSPENINTICEILGLPAKERKNLHILAAKGLGYEI